MREFLADKVCSSMDKAAGTLVFSCQKDYVARIDADLASNTVYSPCSLSHTHIVHDSNAFTAQFGFGVDQPHQDIPYYKGMDKMHKVPPGTRFICSSATSHMRRVSVFLTCLFNALLPEVHTLFGNELKAMGITADWASRSWVLRNTADLIPLLQIWNTQYAQHSIASPKLQTFDFERLYTNIHTADMQQQIMDLVHQIFGLPAHSGHVGIKVWETQPAIWLKANKMPAHDRDRSGSGHGGAFMLFDLATIECWLSYLLTHMYVRFGDNTWRQDQGTPMGTNCAPNLANMYLAQYELRFLQRLAQIHRDPVMTAWHMGVYQIACAFLFTARFLDDLASINNPYMHQLLYVDQHCGHPSIMGIYPHTLLVTVADSGTSVNYMDITIKPQPHSASRLTTVLYDKRAHPPLRDLFIIKFPHASSQISAAAKYGIVTSQFHRFRQIIMSGDNFTHSMAGVIHYMAGKGHDVRRMLDQVKSMTRRFPELYGRDAHCMAAGMALAVWKMEMGL